MIYLAFCASPLGTRRDRYRFRLITRRRVREISKLPRHRCSAPFLPRPCPSPRLFPSLSPSLPASALITFPTTRSAESNFLAYCLAATRSFSETGVATRLAAVFFPARGPLFVRCSTGNLVDRARRAAMCFFAETWTDLILPRATRAQRARR